MISKTENVLDKLPSLIGKNPEQTKVAFIPTAADPCENKHFIEEDRAKWKELDYDLKEISISDKKKKELKEAFESFDIIYLAGGNVFYFLQEAKKCDLGEIIENLLQEGKIYTGERRSSNSWTNH